MIHLPVVRNYVIQNAVICKQDLPDSFDTRYFEGGKSREIIFIPHVVSLFASHPILGTPRKCWNLDSTPWFQDFRIVCQCNLDSGFQILDSRFFVSGIWIPDSNRQQDLDSLSCIPHSKAQNSGFPIPQAKIYRILKSRFPYLGQLRVPCRLIPLK